MKKKLGGVFTIVITAMMAFFMMIPFVGGIDSAYAGQGTNVTVSGSGLGDQWVNDNGVTKRVYCINEGRNPNFNRPNTSNNRVKYVWNESPDRHNSEFINSNIGNALAYGLTANLYNSSGSPRPTNGYGSFGNNEFTRDDVVASSACADLLKKVLYLGNPINAEGHNYSADETQAAVHWVIYNGKNGNTSGGNDLVNKALAMGSVPEGKLYVYVLTTSDFRKDNRSWDQMVVNFEKSASINTQAKTNKSNATNASDGAVEIKIPAGEEKTGLGTVWDVVNYKGLKANKKYALTVQLKDSSGNVLRARENASVNTGSSADGTWDMNALSLQMWPESVGEGTYYFDVKVYEINDNEYTLVATHDGSSDPKEQFRVTKETEETSSEETSSEETSSEETSSEETSSEETSSEETSSEETSSEETSSEETSSEETSSEETSSEETSSEETSSEETSSEETSSEETTTDEEPTTEELDNDKIEELEGKLKTTVNCEGQSGSESSAAQVVIEGNSVVTDVTDKIDYEGLNAGSTYEVKGQLIEVETDKPVATVTENKLAEASSGSWEVTFKDVTIEAGKTYVVYEHATETKDKNGNKVENAKTIKHEDKNDKAQTIVVAKEEEEIITNNSEEETTTVESVYETPSTDSAEDSGIITPETDDDEESSVKSVHESASDTKTADSNGNSNSSGSGTSTSGAKTGDSSPISLLVVMATIAAAAVSMMVARRKREDR